MKLTKAQEDILKAFPPYPEWIVPKDLISFKNPDSQCRKIVEKGFAKIDYSYGAIGEARFRRLKP